MESLFEGNMQWELQFEIESVDYDHEGDIQSTKLVYHADVVEPDEDDEEIKFLALHVCHIQEANLPIQ